MRPNFFRADQLEGKFKDKDKVRSLLVRMRDKPEEAAVPQIEPPDVTLRADQVRLNAADAVVTITATAHDGCHGRSRNGA